MKEITQLAENEILERVASGELKWMAVLINLPLPGEITEQAVFLDTCASFMFRPLLQRGLQMADVEVFETPGSVFAKSLSDSLCHSAEFFYVRDLITAVEAIARDLQMLKLHALSCICYRDGREELWRPVSPAKCLIDPHKFFDNLEVLEDFRKARNAIVGRFWENFRAQHPPANE